ncbi:hypothetical protein [Gordonia aichiensis]|uniref:Uncharacterized protein n=1 Tax=Gordonia aichiensis NBRC 108223 TaxID=1220583 RepID=L7KPJ9_9ACTN|nr:hypothetical protein [Gordonia aichiensis]GAC50790.1 hypothetical protein GOACH_30_00360 [Gordonia aichiensis NBRC 108223]
MSTPGEPSRRPHFSYGRFVTLVLGSGVLVLVVGTPIILALAHWSPIAGLVAALVVVIAMVAVIGWIARRIIGSYERRVRDLEEGTANP